MSPDTEYIEVEPVTEWGIRWGLFDEPTLRYPSEGDALDVLLVLESQGVTGGIIVSRQSFHGQWQEQDRNGEKIV